MPLTTVRYAQIGRALYDKDWVFRMRELLDIPKSEGEQIAFHAARREPYPVPRGIAAPLREALLAKRDLVLAALEMLEAEGDGLWPLANKSDDFQRTPPAVLKAMVAHAGHCVECARWAEKAARALAAQGMGQSSSDQTGSPVAPSRS